MCAAGYWSPAGPTGIFERSVICIECPLGTWSGPGARILAHCNSKYFVFFNFFHKKEYLFYFNHHNHRSLTVRVINDV